VRKPTYRSKRSGVIRRPAEWPEFEGPPRSFWVDLWRDIAEIVERPLTVAMKSRIANGLHPFAPGCYKAQQYLIRWTKADVPRAVDEPTLHQLRADLDHLLKALRKVEAVMAKAESRLPATGFLGAPTTPFFEADMPAHRAFVEHVVASISKHDSLYKQGRGRVHDERDDLLDAEVRAMFEEARIRISSTGEGKFERVLDIVRRAAIAIQTDGRREHGNPNRRRTLRAVVRK
jgi:hypothetical protein